MFSNILANILRCKFPKLNIFSDFTAPCVNFGGLLCVIWRPDIGFFAQSPWVGLERHFLLPRPGKSIPPPKRRSVLFLHSTESKQYHTGQLLNLSILGCENEEWYIIEVAIDILLGQRHQKHYDIHTNCIQNLAQFSLWHW